MQKRKHLLLAGLGIAAMLACPAAAAESIPYDFNGDARVDAFDAVLLKRSRLDDTATSDGDLHTLMRYLVRDGDLSVPDIIEPKGTIHTGEGTFYGGGIIGGCCMLEPVPEGLYICAMNLADYNNAMLAGAYIEATGPSGTVQLYVTDLLPEGKVGDLDLNIQAFPMIAPLEAGRVKVSWKIIPFPTDEPVTYKYKDGSSQFWCGVQVRNHRYPIRKLEYLNADGQFVELPRKQYNYFVSSEMGAGPFTFRVTDIYGDAFVDEEIPFVPEGEVQGKGQFPV